MNKNYLVEIFVPTQGDNDNGVLGAGYPVAQDLILTAHHVVCPENRDPARPVEIRWHHREGAERNWQPITEIAWESKEPFDVALIRCPFPTDISYFGLVSDERPVTHTQWESQGFPLAGKKDNRTSAISMRGTVNSAADTEPGFELGVDHAPELQRHWKGASGSPVFVGTRLIGVVTDCPGNFEARRLLATPLWRLLEEDAGFRDLIDYNDRKNRLTRLTQEVASILQRSSDARTVLRREIPEQKWIDKSDSAEGLAAVLLSLPLEELLMHADTAQEKAPSGEAANIICEAIEAVLPVIIDDAPGAVVDDVCRWKDNPNFSVIELPTDLKTVAEIIMAAADERTAKFRLPPRDERDPAGDLNIDMPPEGGHDSDNRIFNDSWNQHFINEIATEDERKRYSLQELVDMVADELDYRMKKGLTHYVVLTIPGIGQNLELKDMQMRFEQIKQRYPSVVFIYLRNDAERARAEKRKFRPLSDIIMRSSRHKEKKHEIS